MFGYMTVLLAEVSPSARPIHNLPPRAVLHLAPDRYRQPDSTAASSSHPALLGRHPVVTCKPRPCCCATRGGGAPPTRPARCPRPSGPSRIAGDSAPGRYIRVRYFNRLLELCSAFAHPGRPGGKLFYLTLRSVPGRCRRPPCIVGPSGARATVGSPAKLRHTTPVHEVFCSDSRVSSKGRN